MKWKSIVQLGIVAIVAVAAALPATASAGEPQIDPATGGFPLSFAATGGAQDLRLGGSKIGCASYKASGKFTSATTGNIETSFEKCFFSGTEVACTTPGQSSGTITFSESVFHLVYLTDAKTVPGVLITPPAGGVFSNTVCTGELKGAGYMGRLESPTCGGKSATFSVIYEASESTQRYRRITETGAFYNLTYTFGEAALLGTNSWTLERQATLTCI